MYLCTQKRAKWVEDSALAFWFALLITSAKNAQVRQYKSCLNKVNCSESSEQFHKYRERLGHYLSTLSKLLRGAVKAVIDYVQSGYRSFIIVRIAMLGAI